MSVAGISDEDIARVRAASDIVSVFSDRVPVRQRGRDFWCCCPFHDEKTPSCKLDPASQLWHCFGCHAGGDVFSFVMQADDLNFPEAVRKLAERANIHITEDEDRSGLAKGRKTRLIEVCKEASVFYHLQLMRSSGAQAHAAREYLSQRGLGGDIPKVWQLGFAPGNGSLITHLRNKGYTSNELIDANLALSSGGVLKERFFNRVMFPISDVQGQVIAFGGRVVGEGQPKYLNSQETPIFHKSRILFGLDKAKAKMASTGIAVVVEGYTDVIALHAKGITNVVATLGTALSKQHIRTLSRHARKQIIYLFDGDEAGQRALDRALSFLDESVTPEAGQSRIELSAISLPDGLDPAEFVEKQGADALALLFENAQPLIAYGIERRLGKYDLASAESRGAAMADALSILAPIKNSIIAKDYAVQIAGRVRARENDVLARLEELKPLQEPGFEKNSQAAPGSRERGAGHASYEAGSKIKLSQAELNRRKFEREFLSLCARFPGIALKKAAGLAQTRWHEPRHGELAETLLSILESTPEASPAEIVSFAQKKLDYAAALLSSGVMTDTQSPDKLGDYLVEELSLGDLEDTIDEIKIQLEHLSPENTEEQEILFASVVSMQKELSQRRKAHKRIIEL